MQIPSKFEIKELMKVRQGPCISISMSVSSIGSEIGSEIQQNPIRLRELIRRAEQSMPLKLSASACKEALLQPIRALLTDNTVWQRPEEGLCLFSSPGLFRAFHLPILVKDQVVVASHFYLKPLLPFLTNDERFYILALSQHDVRLLEGTRYHIHEIALPERVPVGISAALNYDKTQNIVQSHGGASEVSIGTGGKRSVIFHGQGPGITDTKKNLLRYFGQIDRGLHELLRNKKTPLLLAGVGYLCPLYREASTYPYVLPQEVRGNPDKLSNKELHDRAWTLIESSLLQTQSEVVARYEEYAGTRRASHDINVILPASHYGQVDTLLIASDRELWGSFDTSANKTHVYKKPRLGASDLLDVAATQTLLHDGSVYVLEHDRMPGGKLAAAVFRY
jgi:hypothetical protein